MSPISSFSGLSSGIQWRDMVDQIMSLESKRRLTPVVKQVELYQKRKEAWDGFGGLLSKLSASVRDLRSGSAFGNLQASVSHSTVTNRALFSATASSSASPGVYQVEVIELARAEKLSGAAFNTVGDALGIAGDFSVNGKRVELAAADSLTAVRDKINAANAGSSPSGVSATILSTSVSEHRLVLTSVHQGSRGIELVDGTGSTLQALGINDGTLVQNSKPGNASVTQSLRVSSSSASLAAMLGISSPPAVTTIDVGGRKISVDLENDTLLSVMQRIGSAGGSASITEELVGSTTTYRLNADGPISADLAGSDPTASQRIVELLGFQQGGRASQVTLGSDAKLKIDGFEIQRRTNVIADAVAGVALTLQHAEVGTTINLEVARDLESAIDRVRGFVDAFNELQKFANQQRMASSALGGNATFRGTMSSLTGVLLKGVDTLAADNPFTHASLVGVELNKEGLLQLDAVKLRNTLTTNLTDVKALFGSAGTTTHASVEFLSATHTVQSGTYAVEITAAATRAIHTGSAWADAASYTASDGVSDAWTVTDASTGKIVSLVTEQGKSLSALVAELNTRFEQEGIQLSASEEAGGLKISSAEYGSSAGFSIAGTAVGQLGLTAGDHVGTNVQGTIGGLAATGLGRVLTGTAGAAQGLVVRFTGSTAGPVGEVRYNVGLAGMLENASEAVVRSPDGFLPAHQASITSAMEALDRRADDVQARLDIRREALIRQFTRMEGLMSRLQSQGSWLSSQIQAMQPRRDG